MSTWTGSPVVSLTAFLVAGAFGGGTPGADEAANRFVGTNAHAAAQACSLLTDEQVATVVPGHDGGHEKDTSEASLLKDVSMEHLDIGDLSFLEDAGGTWIATASKGHTVFELRLTAADASAKSEQLVELARAVAAKLWG